jgi:hypothetical protein
MNSQRIFWEIIMQRGNLTKSTLALVAMTVTDRTYTSPIWYTP